MYPGWVKTGMGGPRAALIVEESAQQRVAQLERSDYKELPIFMDFEGRSMNW